MHLDAVIRERLNGFAHPHDGANAIRAVLDLHRPDRYGDCTACGLDGCESPQPHPCPTLQAIGDALVVPR